MTTSKTVAKKKRSKDPANLSALSQQDLLQKVKEALGLTWDELAECSGIAPRALKTYRLPGTPGVEAQDKVSKNFRAMPFLARREIERLWAAHLEG